jgi:hypothetical protein
MDTNFFLGIGATLFVAFLLHKLSTLFKGTKAKTKKGGLPGPVQKALTFQGKQIAKSKHALEKAEKKRKKKE